MAKKMKILHVASEAMPLIKSGGLADVVGALPAALVKEGADARVVIPAYTKAVEAANNIGKVKWHKNNILIEAGGITYQLGVGEIKIEKVVYYLLACDELYGRSGLYGPTPASAYDDNTRRYTVFSKAALAFLKMVNWTPNIIHAHDWQAGLVPVLLERGFQNDLPATRSVFTIHNMAYQGNTWHFDMKLAGLDWALYNPMQLEHNGEFNILKAGIVFADRVTTVSEKYAEEILTVEFGETLDPVLTHHSYKLEGIRNGIDVDIWNPETDELIPSNYTSTNLRGKAACKKRLQKEMGLTQKNKVCLCGVISRLVHQKGLDLILNAVEPYILSGRMQLMVLGSGEQGLEHGFHQLAERHPDSVTFYRGYNEKLSHLIEAGSDVFLMPSRFEPCGLNQMYSLRYGTLPIVRQTGGLADTVTDVLAGGNGFTFGPADAGYFSSVIDRTLGLYEHYPKEWKKIVRKAMKEDFSWETVADEYIAMYKKMTVV